MIMSFLPLIGVFITENIYIVLGRLTSQILNFLMLEKYKQLNNN